MTKSKKIKLVYVHIITKNLNLNFIWLTKYFHSRLPIWFRASHSFKRLMQHKIAVKTK